LVAESEIRGIAGDPWTNFEIEAAVAAYRDMLHAQWRGERFSKTEFVRALQALVPTRNTGSIERKFQNISAILDESGLDWIDGYKPLPHYQHSLRRIALEILGPGTRIAEELAAYGSTALVAAQPRRLATGDVMVAAPGGSSRNRTTVALTGGQTTALHDFQRRELGAAGEEWVIDLEKEQLRRLGRPDLGDRVDWVARSLGDGAGYDIGSFWPDGRSRMIEVKTTNLGPKTPFYITRWEIETSRRHAHSYSLYRVHGFARDPRIYVLDGNVEERARLEPKVYMGLPI